MLKLELLTLFFIILCVLSNSFGQILLKKYSLFLSQSAKSFELNGILYFLVPGIFLYVLGMVFWIQLLKTVPLNVAYPILASAFIVVPLLSVWLLNEPFKMQTLIGALLIILGIGVSVK